ncbi:hypothetical protein [Verrucosispora sp. WMMD573]|nr:hypothetical protein [Verrucosispora sp. WMMD573]WBB55010.1 hypothetical protein O7601_02410 [Verrucosispora sp. WMMD573]
MSDRPTPILGRSIMKLLPRHAGGADNNFMIDAWGGVDRAGVWR